MAEVLVPIFTLAHGSGLSLPAYATLLAAGLDLPAAIDAPVEIAPWERMLIPTGFVIALPEGYEGQVRPRSGLALKSGLTVLNAPGTIDADYRGEVKVLLINLGDKPAQLHRGDRIAQLVVAPVARVTWRPATQLDDTERGEGGYGSTGIAANAAGG